jgi:2-polyprenyl-6-methoxyphenol hydroxylase-like FAD-dependent oxidoreductase
VEDELRRLLASHGVEVERGTEVVGFSDGGGRVTATLAGGEQIEAEYLIGCDGGRSSVRQLLGVAFAGTSAPEEAMFCGDVEVDGPLDRDAWHQWFTPEGGVLLCPFEGTPVWQFQARPELDANGRMGEPSLESFQRLFDRHARMPGVKLRNATWTFRGPQ